MANYGEVGIGVYDNGALVFERRTAIINDESRTVLGEYVIRGESGEARRISFDAIVRMAPDLRRNDMWKFTAYDNEDCEVVIVRRLTWKELLEWLDSLDTDESTSRIASVNVERDG